VLVVERGGQLIGIGQYDRIPGGDAAEVVFVIPDAYQDLGIGSLLLECVASKGRRCGLKRFAGDTLMGNNPMVKVFHDAGLTTRSRLDSGVIQLVMDSAPTPGALKPLDDQKATASSMRGLLQPRSIAVIGASRAEGKVGHRLVRKLGERGFPRSGVPGQPDRCPHCQPALFR
jgi:hypothetical protein